MNYGIKEVKNVKIYDLKTGKEIKSETFTKKTKEEIANDFEKQFRKKMLQKTTGYADPCLCPHCDKYYEGYNTHYNVDGDFRCEHCIKDEPKMKLVPHFVSNIPSYCDGATCNVFTFKDINTFYKKIRDRLSKGNILVKSTDDYYIMEQSIEKSWWWVLGGINCFNEKLNIPYVNYDIYNKDKTVDKDKVSIWLNGFDVISGIE